MSANRGLFIFWALGHLILPSYANPFSLDLKENKINFRLSDKTDNSKKEHSNALGEETLKDIGKRLKAALESEDERELAQIDSELLAFPNSAKIAALRGVIAFYRGDYPKASALLEAALIDPRLLTKNSIRLLLGQAQLLSDKSFSAWRNFDIALRIGPENWFVWYLRGLASLELDDLEAAKKDLRHSFILNSQYKPTYLHLAWLEFMDGNYGETIAILTKAYDSQEKNLEAIVLLAKAEEALGNAGRSAELLKEYLTLTPDPTVEGQLASLSFGKGDYSEALASYDRAIAQQANNPLLYLNRAMVYLQRGEADKAKADLLQALELRCNFSRKELERETRDLLKRLEMEQSKI